ncbi:2'-5' RNA ligase [Deinococcus sp. KSM4-11]|uniref:RNA ligase family protein n=1 Tax=Deinococcus sp. KSM4-11 TaxID=2568654 RepID=UPI0010A52905|nr:RNA ligase family protein [Deinococcus sp. KSM4-11]THF87859.1 2'-5' RNA ligase [Deinococcus sp. KSM4-11]
MERHYKYPRTSHLPWSPGLTSDDQVLGSADQFHGREVVITEKLDGESTSVYPKHVHARSLDPRPHPSRDLMKALQAELGYRIPEGWRLCGEYLYARHSIAYDDLEGYFYLFSVWDEHNRALSWDETRMWAEELALPTPRELYRGPWDEALTRALEINFDTTEGYVVRVTDSFAYEDFGTSLAKYVRRGHVQTDQHWMHGEVVPNRLRTRP